MGSGLKKVLRVRLFEEALARLAFEAEAARLSRIQTSIDAKAGQIRAARTGAYQGMLAGDGEGRNVAEADLDLYEGAWQSLERARAVAQERNQALRDQLQEACRSRKQVEALLTAKREMAAAKEARNEQKTIDDWVQIRRSAEAAASDRRRGEAIDRS